MAAKATNQSSASSASAPAPRAIRTTATSQATVLRPEREPSPEPTFKGMLKELKQGRCKAAEPRRHRREEEPARRTDARSSLKPKQGESDQIVHERLTHIKRTITQFRQGLDTEVALEKWVSTRDSIEVKFQEVVETARGATQMVDDVLILQAESIFHVAYELEKAGEPVDITLPSTMKAVDMRRLRKGAKNIVEDTDLSRSRRTAVKAYLQACEKQMESAQASESDSEMSVQ